MWWWLLFGAIVLVAIVLYALLGRWLWHKARALFVELGDATERLEAAAAQLEAYEPARSSAPPGLAERAGAAETAETGRHRGPTVRRSSGRGRISA